jgi:uncharacterized membrane protein
MKLSYAYLATAAVLASAVPAHAATETFGQFIQKQSNARLFSYTNEDSGATKKAEIAGNSIPVYFQLAANGLPADLSGLQDAHLTVDFLSNVGTTGSGTDRSQLFDTVTAGTITFLRDTAAAEGTGSKTNLLTVTFTNAQLNASQNAGSFTFKSNANSVITYSSDFLDFSNVISKDFSFSFSGASPTFSAPIGSSSRSISFSGSGTFASDPAPLVVGVPEPATWAMMLVGFGAMGATLRSGKKQQAARIA